MKKISARLISFSTVINFFLFLYILSLYLFSFRTALTFISNGLALILVFLIWIKVLKLKENIIYNKLLLHFILFIGISMLSTLYALNQETALTKVITLILILVVMISLTNYIDTMAKMNKVIKYFIISGFIASIYILLTSEFSQASRIGETLGNINEIGMIIGISATFCFYVIIIERRYCYSFLLFVMFITILLTGSRKSLLFIMLNISIIYLLNDRNNIQKNIKTVISMSLAGLILYFIIFNNPLFYQIIGSRIENTFNFLLGTGTSESSMNIRANMINYGIEVFKNRPLLGHGLDNYRVLMGKEISGIGTYAHNNYIELLVDVGIVGIIIYYTTHLTVIKRLVKQSNNKVSYPFIAIIVSYFIIGMTLVYYDSKHFAFLMALGALIPDLKSNYYMEKNS